MKTGLVSVTFRNKTPEEIIPMVKKAGLQAIEWGSDVHVPPTDPARAEKIYDLCQEAGIDTPSYGSYYRCAVTTDEDFDAVCKTAKILHARTIRIWGGDKGCDVCTPEHRAEIVADARRVAEIAKKYDLTIAFEFHNGTLTQEADSALRLLEEVGCDNVKTYWQPLWMYDFTQNMENLKIVKGHLANVHAFGDQRATIPMEQSAGEWEQYRQVLDTVADEESPVCYLEFVKGACDEQFYEDAACLRRVLG